jgi:uncharacterized protein (TIGR03067 family)
MRRLLTLLGAVLLSLAFAPAPFPRLQRERQGIDLAQFQGTWKVVGHHHWRAAQKLPNPWSITHIRVRKDCWTLMVANQENASYRIELNPANKPCTIDWRGPQGEALWLGLIRRDKEIVEIIYLPAGQRPGNFETPPMGSTLITLQRGR